MPDPNATNPAPPLERKPVRVTLSGTEYQITPLSPRAALRVVFRVAKVLGAPLAALLSGAGIPLPGLVDEDGAPLTDADGNPLRANLAMILNSSVARGALVGTLLEGLSGMNVEDLDQLVDTMLIGTRDAPLLHVHHSGAWVPIASGAMLDTMVPDVWTLIGLAKAAFQLNALPTLADDDTDPA